MTTPAEIVAEARAWCGAPLFHKGRSREGGVDCLGLVLVVGWATGAVPGDVVIPDYAKLPNPRVLVAAMDAAARRLPFAVPGDGDIIGLSWGKRDHPMHLALMATLDGRRTIIHASPRHGRVLETGFAGGWAASFCAAWRFPNLAV